MNNPRIFPKSLKLEGSNFKMCKISKIFICLIGYICKTSKYMYYFFTVYKCQHAEITWFLYLLQYLHFLTPLILSELKT